MGWFGDGLRELRACVWPSRYPAPGVTERPYTPEAIEELKRELMADTPTPPFAWKAYLPEDAPEPEPRRSDD